MTEITEIDIPIENAFKKYIPIVTTACCVISIFLFLGINLEGKLDNWGVYNRWGAPNVIEIFNGSYWGLITTNFLHTQIWHIAFNLYWLWILGKKVEFETTKTFYILFIISAALVSSLSQIGFADTSGIGLSGIGYALFGFIFIKNKTTESYKNYLDKRTINLFLFWLVICLFLTHTNMLIVGNAAHIGGLLWGITLAYISKFKNYKQWAIGFSLICILFSSIFLNPFSISWLSHQAYELHKNQKIDKAIIIYKKILSRDPKSEFAKVNLKQLEITSLQKKSFDLHKALKYNEARKIYNEILILDSSNQWAKDNLNKLPPE